MSSTGGGSSRKKEEAVFWSRGDWWLFSLEASIISSSTAGSQHVQSAISTPVKTESDHLPSTTNRISAVFITHLKYIFEKNKQQQQQQQLDFIKIADNLIINWSLTMEDNKIIESRKKDLNAVQVHASRGK